MKSELSVFTFLIHNPGLFVSESPVNVVPEMMLFVFIISHHNVKRNIFFFFDHLLLFWFGAPTYPSISCLTELTSQT